MFFKLIWKNTYKELNNNENIKKKKDLNVQYQIIKYFLSSFSMEKERFVHARSFYTFAREHHAAPLHWLEVCVFCKS